MLDFDVGKLVVIGVVALIVIGPKDLPRVLRQVGNAVGKMRRMANEFQGQFMEAMREADVEDLKKDLDKAADAIKLDSAFDPLKDAHNDLVKSIEDQSSAVEALASVDAPAAPPESLDPAMDAAQGAAEPAPVEAAAPEPHAFEEATLEPPVPAPPAPEKVVAPETKAKALAPEAKAEALAPEAKA